MTKQDFVLIANVINQHPWDTLDEQLLMAQEMGKALTSTNPRFNDARFIDACMTGTDYESFID